MAETMVPPHPHPPCGGRGAAHHMLSLLCLKRRVEIELRQSNADGAMAPRRGGFRAAEQAHIEPVVFFRVIERLFESEGGARDAGVSGVLRRIGQLTEGPGDPADPMGEPTLTRPDNDLLSRRRGRPGLWRCRTAHRRYLVRFAGIRPRRSSRASASRGGMAPADP